MRYEILGTVQVTEAGKKFSLKSPRLEALLSVLLIRTNQVVSGDQLITELWGEETPRQAPAGLYVYVSQLRKLLRYPGISENPIVTLSTGYQLQVHPGELDHEVFQQAIRDGRRHLAMDAPLEAAAVFESGLALWRGPALGGLPGGPIISGFTTSAEESKLECQELLVEARLALGQHRQVIGLLYSLIAEYPLQEAFYRLLMLALYRSHRQADALLVYQQARNVITAELGMEPCRVLRDLHQAILIDDSDRLLCG